GLAAGDYTLTAARTDCSFIPPSLAVTITSADVSGQDFTADCSVPTFSISGQVTDDSGDGVAGVTIADGAGNTATTGSDGTYTVSGLAAGDYTLTAARTDCSFIPPSLAVTITSADVSGQDFTADCSVPTFSISGQVTDDSGDGVAGVTIADGAGNTATTGNDGTYTISGLAAGDYTLTPSKDGYTFAPASRSVSVPPHASGQDFTAEPLLITIANLSSIESTPIPADGVSTVSITATVPNQGSGTAIVFDTTLGTLNSTTTHLGLAQSGPTFNENGEAVANSSVTIPTNENGEAVAILTAPDTPGVATVTVTIGSVSQSFQVRFVDAGPKTVYLPLVRR
ncbi:MAG: carboxypeptidase regulatory-like domain-containing protein, partial [Chloroflexaceae bacterium]|nr:carboxypeptidase regulatory-like domain-containing protein [Chloroflexaceae bacterium]